MARPVFSQVCGHYILFKLHETQHIDQGRQVLIGRGFKALVITHLSLKFLPVLLVQVVAYKLVYAGSVGPCTDGDGVASRL